ncbi:MAG: hypothetical protein GXP19_08215 [Gammaproteobacteria bacterium]|nr:hypothetical protein [Gammaproteobacteria bacterium]
MNTASSAFRAIRSGFNFKKTSLLLAPALVLGLTGCITSPFYGQQMKSRFDPVPFTFWTFDKTKSVTVECAKASAHGGPYNGNGSYQPVETIWPTNKGQLDSFGSMVYDASKNVDIPSACWRNYDLGGGTNWITVLRVKQNGSDNGVYTFDKAGLECMGKWNGKNASWTSWLSHNCNKKYINTGDHIRTVFLKSK